MSNKSGSSRLSFALNAAMRRSFLVARIFCVLSCHAHIALNCFGEKLLTPGVDAVREELIVLLTIPPLFAQKKW